MWRKAFLCLFIGVIFYIVGSMFAGPAKSFIAESEPATLIVLQVDEKRSSRRSSNSNSNSSNRNNSNSTRYTYRPVFGLETDVRPRPEYAGSTWVSPKPHEAGDIVAGRYNPVTGEMRSDKMASRTFWIGRIAQIIGILVMLQGVLIFFGFRSLLPMRIGSK